MTEWTGQAQIGKMTSGRTVEITEETVFEPGQKYILKNPDASWVGWVTPVYVGTTPTEEELKLAIKRKAEDILRLFKSILTEQLPTINVVGEHFDYTATWVVMKPPPDFSMSVTIRGEIRFDVQDISPDTLFAITAAIIIAICIGAAIVIFAATVSWTIYHVVSELPPWGGAVFIVVLAGLAVAGIVSYAYVKGKG